MYIVNVENELKTNVTANQFFLCPNQEDDMNNLLEQVELLKELLYLAPTDCLSCPKRDYWNGNEEMPGELACYEDCDDRNNWQELLYVFNDVQKAESKDKYSDEYDEWAELHDKLADDIGAMRGTSEVFS